MRVRMKTAAANAVWAAGAGDLTPDLPAAEAKALVAGGYASLVDEKGADNAEASRTLRKGKRETATPAAAETAAQN